MRNYWQLQAPDARRSAQVPQQGSSPVQSTAWMERRRPALPEGPRSELEPVLCAKRIKSFSQWPSNKVRSGLHSARATSRNCSAHARAHETYREPAAPATAPAQRAVISPNSRQPQRAAELAARVKRRRRRNHVAPRRKIAGVARRRRATSAATLDSMEPQYDSKRCEAHDEPRRARDAAAHRCW